MPDGVARHGRGEEQAIGGCYRDSSQGCSLCEILSLRPSSDAHRAHNLFRSHHVYRSHHCSVILMRAALLCSCSHTDPHHKGVLEYSRIRV
jgi:hypothetical protein